MQLIIVSTGGKDSEANLRVMFSQWRKDHWFLLTREGSEVEVAIWNETYTAGRVFECCSLNLLSKLAERFSERSYEGGFRELKGTVHDNLGSPDYDEKWTTRSKIVR
ncbi:unnamed protein product [Haemonchus placei]|uniref:TIR domain-containing protein n=1 Tax=Haemonchus placei TaxID=6290 RepID=A0A0N4X2B5_HAEPC|nr:unnamed protein product [Haemonchus placei]